MAKSMAMDFLRTAEKRAHIRLTLICGAITVCLAGATTVSFLRPDWIQFVLIGATLLALILTGIAIMDYFEEFVWRRF